MAHLESVSTGGAAISIADERPTKATDYRGACAVLETVEADGEAETDAGGIC